MVNQIEVVTVSDLAKEAGSYSHCLRVRADADLLVVSGQVPLDSSGALVGQGDPNAQSRQVFKNLASVLEAAGSSLDSLIRLGIFMTSRDHVRAFVGARAEFLSAPYPASTFVLVPSLLDPEWLVEVEATAVVAT